ncbi:uncharacterized protein LOC143861279 [Tasmannia lanceolata]|uniref:uncharacterized protein LOC143861279 n=1 Tax=Tasmannia lanceolata TaxID=3420 RepID=UPI0040648C61
MTSAAESITESLHRTRQLMVQEVERSASTLTTFEESRSVLRKAESEYKGHRSLLMRTRRLLTTMKRQDVLDRVILVVGFLFFASAVLYVVSKRVGLLKLHRKLTAAIKAGSIGLKEIGPEKMTSGAQNGLDLVKNDGIGDPNMEVPSTRMHDEL